MATKKASKRTGPRTRRVRSRIANEHSYRPVLRCGGSRATEKVAMPAAVRNDRQFAHVVEARLMSRQDFVAEYGSGTLRKNESVGMDVTGQYLHERTAFEFGWPFESIDETRVTWGQPISMPDCAPMTETGWHIKRYMSKSAFPGDQFETKYIIVEYPDGKRKEGLGLVVRKTSAQFVPARHMVFAIITEWDVHAEVYKEAINPC